MGLSEALDEKFRLLATWHIDTFIVRKPLFFNVSIYLYILPLIGFVLAYSAAHAIGMLRFPGDVPYELMGPLAFIIGIASVGSIVASELRYVDEDTKVRLLESRLGRILGELMRGGAGSLRVSGRAYAYMLVIVCALVAFWLYLKPHDELAVALFRLAEEGDYRGYLGLALDTLSTCVFIFFWIIAGFAFMHFLWVHHRALSMLSRAVKREMKGENTLRLDTILMNNILSRDRPALYFLQFRSRIIGMTEALSAVMKRLLLLSILVIALAIPVDITFRGHVTYVAISAIIIGAGLAIPVAWAICIITRWSSELQTLILVELKNIRIRAYARHDEVSMKATEELEYLAREFKHALIQSRELWELIAALITLVATIIGVLVGLNPR